MVQMRMRVVKNLGHVPMIRLCRALSTQFVVLAQENET